MIFKRISLPVVVVLTIVIIGSRILYFQAKHSAKSVHVINNHQVQNIHQISSPIPTGAGDQNNPVTWSRYTYSHNFSINYPPYWNVVLDQDGNGVSFMTTGFHQDDDFSMPYGNSDEVMYTIFGQNNVSDMSFKDGDQFPSDITSETMAVINLKQLRIDGFPAVEFDYYPTDNTNFLRTRISIQKGKGMYRFNATYATDAGKQFFEEMMNSLKFTS